jgi:hypothetical protein
MSEEHKLRRVVPVGCSTSQQLSERVKSTRMFLVTFDIKSNRRVVVETK